MENNCLNKIDELFAEGEDYLKKGNLTLAKETFLQIVKNDPKNDKVYYKLGTIALTEADYVRALAYLAIDIDVTKDRCKSFHNIAVSLDALKLYDVENVINSLYESRGCEECKEALHYDAIKRHCPGIQYNIGINFEKGNGVEKNNVKAVEWYKKSAEQGYSLAQFKLGVCYGLGLGVKQDYSKAFNWYKKSAEQGNSTAQYNLGFYYANGRGSEQDYSKAFVWYKKSADQGYSTAQFNLGVCYAKGQGVEQDYSKAFKWYKKSAEQGDPTAQCNLGFYYANGRGVGQNYSIAVKWYMKSAKKGYSIAQYFLGVCYDEGLGVERDYSKAIEWYSRSAEQGDSDAQLNLGNCYYNGKGVDKDYSKAIEWYRESAEQGNVDAKNMLSKLYDTGGYQCKDLSKCVHVLSNDAENIRSILEENSIRCFYHFTEISNIEQIKKMGGLFSWEYCKKNNIQIPRPGGGEISRRLDLKYDLQNYVRLSFCEHHPMIYKLRQKGYNLILLRIAIDVAFWEGTLFSDMNATDNNHRLSKMPDIVVFDAFEEDYIEKEDPLFKYYQAEILVREFIPLKFIEGI
jgi:uncharacterized protein